MPSQISRDPEHLKIPAFMRKRELSTRSKNKLELTALDRKEKGVLPTGVSKRTASSNSPTLIEDERRMRAEARMEHMRATGQIDKGFGVSPSRRKERETNNGFNSNSYDDSRSSRYDDCINPINYNAASQNGRDSGRSSYPTNPTKKLPSISDHASRRPSNMWEIAIAEIHKEKHPDARVVPKLTPRARKNEQENYDDNSSDLRWNSQQSGNSSNLRRHSQSRDDLGDSRGHSQSSENSGNLRRHSQPSFEYPLFNEGEHAQSSYYRPDRTQRLSHELQNAPTKQGPTAETLKAIGEVTQVYSKINVAVIRLDEELSVGDSVTYQTTDGSHTQTVLSMEIDRKPIFTARAGDEVGIKLYKQALVGKVVYVKG